MIRSEVLQPPDGAGQGLLGEYFAAGDVVGAPALSRIDPRCTSIGTVRMRRWCHSSRAHSLRWMGTLQAPYSGDYVVGVARPECQDCSGRHVARLYLDDQPVVGENTPMKLLHRTQGAHVQMAAGVSYRVRLEYQQQRGNPGIELVWIPPAGALLEGAVQMVSRSDAALLFLDLNADLESEKSGLRTPGFLQGDRTDIQLPEPQQQLLRAVLDTGKPVVVVLMSGSAIVASGAEEEAAAVLQAWYSGEEGGNAIARTLPGDSNPAGRLPVTFYRSADQLPPFDDYSMTGRTYRFFTGRPSYGFGYGLSYSRFRYSELAVDGDLHVSVRVSSESARDGDEVAQLYAGREGAPRQLAGFERLHLAAGQSRVVRFLLSPDVVAGGDRITVSVGGGQPVPGSSYVQFTQPR